MARVKIVMNKLIVYKSYIIYSICISRIWHKIICKSLYAVKHKQSDEGTNVVSTFNAVPLLFCSIIKLLAVFSEWLAYEHCCRLLITTGKNAMPILVTTEKIVISSWKVSLNYGIGSNSCGNKLEALLLEWTSSFSIFLSLSLSLTL